VDEKVVFLITSVKPLLKRNSRKNGEIKSLSIKGYEVSVVIKALKKRISLCRKNYALFRSYYLLSPLPSPLPRKKHLRR
jgi:hypothetical protein